jgi:hypothetical protein
MTRCFRVVDLRVSIFIFHPTNTSPPFDVACLVFSYSFISLRLRKGTLCVLEKPYFLNRHLATHARILEFFFDHYGTGLSLPWLMTQQALGIMADGCLCNFQPASSFFSVSPGHKLALPCYTLVLCFSHSKSIDMSC